MDKTKVQCLLDKTKWSVIRETGGRNVVYIWYAKVSDM